MANAIDLGVGGGIAQPGNVQPVSASNGSGSLYDMLAADRAFSLASARETNAFNAAEAKKARDWQEYMSNTSHQREVKDLIAAGLNPVLSANSGASAYNAAQASGVKPDTPSGANALANIMAAAISASAMVNVAQINANSALSVKKQEGVNQINTAEENHKNNLFGSLWSLIDYVSNDYQSAKGMSYKDYLNLRKK